MAHVELNRSRPRRSFAARVNAHVSDGLAVWLLSLTSFTIVCGCEGDPQPGTAAGQLATLYSDSTRWCKKQGECQVKKDECAQRWPDRASALLAAGQLAEEQADSCLKATLALDACALKLPCEEFKKFYALDYCEKGGELVTCCFDESGADKPCPDAKCSKEEMAFVKQCESLEQLLGR